MITKGRALASLRPGAEWNVLNGEITWLDSDQECPTDEEIVQEQAKLEYEDEINVYKQQRADEYPSWGVQLDYIYHNGIDAWKTDIVDPIKAKYPKQTIDNEELERRKAQALSDYQDENV